MSKIMCLQNLVEFCPFILKIWSKSQILASIKGHNSCEFAINNDLQYPHRSSMMMCIQNLVSFCQFILKTLSKNQNLTSIKGRNPFANLRKTIIFITNVDLVNDNEYTKFSLILSICSQVIE